jgi:hypothetical protein
MYLELLLLLLLLLPPLLLPPWLSMSHTHSLKQADVTGHRHGGKEKKKKKAAADAASDRGCCCCQWLRKRGFLSLLCVCERERASAFGSLCFAATLVQCSLQQQQRQGQS